MELINLDLLASDRPFFQKNSPAWDRTIFGFITVAPILVQLGEEIGGASISFCTP